MEKKSDLDRFVEKTFSTTKGSFGIITPIFIEEIESGVIKYSDTRTLFRFTIQKINEFVLKLTGQTEEGRRIKLIVFFFEDMHYLFSELERKDICILSTKTDQVAVAI
jgi:hypothetical protein